jgi:hypothetical protein
MLRKEILRLVQRLLILSVMVGCLILLTAPQLAHADLWGECDAAFEARNDICFENWFNCILDGPQPYHTCSGDYNQCMTNAIETHTNCLAGQPGPGGGGDEGHRTSCIQACDEVYFECYYNGANTGSYEDCMEASDGNAEDCCYAERVHCMTSNCN